VPVIELETWIPATADRCFELSLSVDAHTESMRTSHERVVGGVMTGQMAHGDVVTWRARHFGIPFTMTSRISDYDAPGRFVDEQVRGPFRRWRHEHRFEAADGGTRMRDRIEFQSPAGPLGRVVDRLVLTDYMTRLIEYRNDYLVTTLSEASGASG